jgi:hypothetical protein
MCYPCLQAQVLECQEVCSDEVSEGIFSFRVRHNPLEESLVIMMHQVIAAWFMKVFVQVWIGRVLARLGGFEVMRGRWEGG